jgi:hypothetical protein
LRNKSKESELEWSRGNERERGREREREWVSERERERENSIIFLHRVLWFLTQKAFIVRSTLLRLTLRIQNKCVDSKNLAKKATNHK